MAVIGRSLMNLGRNFIISQPRRSISVTPIARLKEIIKRKEGNTLIIEAKIVPDAQESKLIEQASNGACFLCSTGLQIKHTDVLILSQFLRSNGTIMPRRITGLCKIQQKRINSLVAMAQKAGLMPNIAPASSKRDPKQRYGLKSFNVYYDESTIRAKYYNVKYRL
ncbi:hypothetical protein PV325_003540 [Microctonus aethiopoides]|uniref:Ribosomal protein S18 n=1 Tax=Microctonus aethiopoides TaxID=144406 RepID=A0AA39F7E6_9HYME|nr:hypothetical protein PV325_003540 [Microctonus aethiopoides]KAK0096215.1 hypothetical protein PV326_006074 [Microctonus aethiopoides]KAK0164239.1 hypothetical protein PV328_002888 [Microctonus aethiopoides]